MYGLWIANQGWVKSEKDALAFDDYSFALEAARYINARVRRIDDSWKDLERFYLENESKRKSLWDTLLNLLKLRTNK